MTFGPLPFVDTPGAARSEVYPSITMGTFSEVLGASGSAFFEQQVDAVNIPGSVNWIIAARPICSWHIVANSGDATLNIHVSGDGSIFSYWRSFPLFENAINGVNSMTGLYIPGFMCNFQVVTVAAQTVTGFIKLQGVS